jgi:hypothetical protein
LCVDSFVYVWDMKATREEKKGFISLSSHYESLPDRIVDSDIHWVPVHVSELSKLQASRLCLHENSTFLYHFAAAVMSSLPGVKLPC